MPTCTVPMHSDAFMCTRVKLKKHKYATTLKCPRIPGFTPLERNIHPLGGPKNIWQEWDLKPHPSFLRKEFIELTGFTLTEMMVVIIMVSLFVLMAQMNLFGMLRKNTFRAQVQDLISTMQMATNAAAESNRRYEFIIDPTEQNYILREITSPDLSQVLQEEIIVENNLSDNCRVTYIEFDDGESINNGWAKFRAGHSGWQYGGKIVLLDNKEQPYSIVVNRLNRTVSLIKGDVGLLEPKAKEEVPF